jgi:hypothetical protein
MEKGRKFGLFLQYGFVCAAFEKNSDRMMQKGR